MKKTVEFLFVVDVSGSMHGQKIASVNAVLTECLTELRTMENSENFNILVSIASFAEKMQMHKLNEKIEAVGVPQLEVKKQEDGFYPITSFSCLYKGLQYLFEKGKINDGEQGENTFIFLISDAKPVDKKEYKSVFLQVQSDPVYKNAAKYVAFVDEKADRYNKETVRFVNYAAERIVRLDNLTGEISKLQMTFFTGSGNQSENEKYDEIFV